MNDKRRKKTFSKRGRRAGRQGQRSDRKKGEKLIVEKSSTTYTSSSSGGDDEQAHNNDKGRVGSEKAPSKNHLKGKKRASLGHSGERWEI